MTRKGRIKVLHLIARMNIGGPAVLVCDLAAGLPRDRFEVRIGAGAVGEGETQMDFQAQAQGVYWETLEGLSPSLARGNLTGLRSIRRIINEFRPDIIHTHTAKAGALGRLGALIGSGKYKIIHTFHGHVFRGYFSPLKTKAFLAVEKFLARRTDAVVVLSREQADDICREFGVCNLNRIRTIPIGLDLDPFRTGEAGFLRDKLGISPNVFLVGFVGRLTGIKDPVTMIRGVAEAAAGSDRRIELVIFGQGDLEEQAREEAGRHPHFKVHFYGWIEGTSRIYKDLDLVVLASANEGLPLVLVESLAAGTPVISTPVGGVPSLLNMGKYPDNQPFAFAERGLVFPIGDSGGLSRGIEWVITHKNEATELAELGREHVLARHSRERFIRDHISLYESLAGD